MNTNDSGFFCLFWHVGKYRGNHGKCYLENIIGLGHNDWGSKAHCAECMATLVRSFSWKGGYYANLWHISHKYGYYILIIGACPEIVGMNFLETGRYGNFPPNNNISQNVKNQ